MINLIGNLKQKLVAHLCKSCEIVFESRPSISSELRVESFALFHPHLLQLLNA